MGAVISASRHTWLAASEPQCGYRSEAITTICAICADNIQRAIPLAEIETSTMSNHADFFRFGNKHVCEACGWLFGLGRGRPGNFIAIPGRYEEVVISRESIVSGKRAWFDVLRELADAPTDTVVSGVMTTDVKPRLWPRTRLATIGGFGLYLHAPDYDVSGFVRFDLSDCIRIMERMVPVLAAGYAKASIHFSLFRDFARASADPSSAIEMEGSISPYRSSPAFLPALIAAGITKEEKHDIKTRRPDWPAQRTPAASHQPAPAQLELF